MAQQKEISVTGWAIASELCVWLVLFLFSADACVISSLWILRKKGRRNGTRLKSRNYEKRERDKKTMSILLICLNKSLFLDDDGRSTESWAVDGLLRSHLDWNIGQTGLDLCVAQVCEIQTSVVVGARFCLLGFKF